MNSRIVIHVFCSDFLQPDNSLSPLCSMVCDSHSMIIICIGLQGNPEANILRLNFTSFLVSGLFSEADPEGYLSSCFAKHVSLSLPGNPPTCQSSQKQTIL